MNLEPNENQSSQSLHPEPSYAYPYGMSRLRYNHK